MAILILCEILNQIVKAQGTIGRIDNIRLINQPLLLGRQIFSLISYHRCLNSQPQKTIDLPHFLSVTQSQIGIGGHQHSSLTRQGIEIERHGSRQSLALSRSHLSDISFMENNRPHDLHIVGEHAQHPLVRFPHHSISLRQQVV